MLSKKQLTFAHSLYYSLTKCGLYPFILDLKSAKISRQRSKFRWNLWLFFLFLVACRASLGTVRIIFAFLSPTKTPAEDIPLMINQSLYWVAVYIFPCLFHKYMDVTISVFNSLLENPVRRSTWRTATVQELVVLFILPPNVFFIPALYAGMLALRPMAPFNLFSALKPTWQSTPVLFAIILADSFIMLYIWALVVFVTHILLLFFQKCIEETSHTLQTVTRITQNDWQRTIKIEEAIQDMRKLQLLIHIYNVGYKEIHALTKVLALFWFITFTSFGILISRLHPFMSFAHLFFGIQTSILYCATFHKAFAIPMLTRKVKTKLSNLAKSSSNGQNKGYFGAWTRSIPPIGIKVGNFHLFERMSTPNFLAFGIKNITRILIARRSQ